MPKRKTNAEEWREYRHDNGELLNFRFVRSARKTLALYVNRDGSVLVRAPLRMSLSYVFVFIQERWAWLLKQRDRFLAEPVAIPFEYADGKEFLHLGQSLVLRVDIAARNQARLVDNELHVSITPERRADVNGVADIVGLWQRREAKRVFPFRLAVCYEFMQDLQRPFPELKIRKMRSRWGSCARDGVITLNLELIKMPLECIDYVVTHELCHLVEFNHSVRFYELQSRYMPDWKAKRQSLDLLARQQYGL